MSAFLKKIFPRHPQPCPLCGTLVPLQSKPTDDDKCPGCKQAARTRSIAVLFDQVIAPLALKGSATQNVLGFAVTSTERILLGKIFSGLTSVSLYGNYGEGHVSGVDARDLSRFPDESYSAHFSCMLFDYFEEMQTGIQEAYRVLETGGIFITHIGTHRLTQDLSPPRLAGEFRKDPNRYAYLPEGASLGDTRVGTQWFLDAMCKVGFLGRMVVVKDVGGRRNSYWFIGVRTSDELGAVLPTIKLGGPAKTSFLNLKKPLIDTVSEIKKMGRVTAKAIGRRFKKQSLPARTASPADGPIHLSKTYAIPLQLGEQSALLEIKLSAPELPAAYRKSVGFAEHVMDTGTRLPTQTIVCLGDRGRVVISNDLGKSWKAVSGLDVHDRALRCFTTSTGRHLVQLRGWEKLGDEDEHPHLAQICVFDKDWKLIGRSSAGINHWHGTSSIDEANGVIMFAEYPDNGKGYVAPDAATRARVTRPSCVWRSRDDGMTWEKRLEVDSSILRHFHTCRADLFLPNTWWLSSGDRAHECQIWRSDDNGNSWINVTNVAPNVSLHRHAIAHAQAIHRHTDVWISDSEMIWGTDDHLGNIGQVHEDVLRSERVGSRVYCVDKSSVPLRFTELGFCGQPVRSIVETDIGLIMLTEAKQGAITLRPEVHLVPRQGNRAPIKLLDVDNFSGKPTGFCYSLASRKAMNGVFFSYKHPDEVFPASGRILKWEIKVS